jgi:hypothetical protein
MIDYALPYLGGGGIKRNDSHLFFKKKKMIVFGVVYKYYTEPNRLILSKFKVPKFQIFCLEPEYCSKLENRMCIFKKEAGSLRNKVSVAQELKLRVVQKEEDEGELHPPLFHIFLSSSLVSTEGEFRPTRKKNLRFSLPYLEGGGSTVLYSGKGTLLFVQCRTATGSRNFAR